MGVTCSCQPHEDHTAEVVVPGPKKLIGAKSPELEDETPALSDASTKVAPDESQVTRAISSSFHLEKVEAEDQEALVLKDENFSGRISRDSAADMLEEIKEAIQAQDFSAARDISKPTAKVLFLHKPNPPRDLVQFGINSKEQVSTIPLLEVKDERIVCGTIPTIWALNHWPLWFPFCESNQLLRRFSPSCFVINCVLKVLFLRIDFILFVDIADKLHTSEECLEILMRSPPPGSEGEQWMGVTIPPKCGSLPRICIRDSMLRLNPTAMDHFRCDLQMEMEDQGGAPQWAKVFVFQQLGIRIIPELCKFQSKIPGSVLDKFLNSHGTAGPGEDVIDKDGLDYIFNLQRSIETYVNGKVKPATGLPGLTHGIGPVSKFVAT